MDEDLKRQEPQEAVTAEADLKPTVVGIGASAGGLAALKRLFARIPPDSGLAFVVVVHLSPEHKSLLAELLQPNVRFPVRQVTETVLVEANHVYVIPPNANLSAIDTHLRLSRLEQQRRERAPIDHFFRTLAATHDGHSIGLILTGTGSDGTLGLKEIKAKGGFILVQDPNEAEFDGMPQSAIATGLVDRVLPIDEIPEALIRLSQAKSRLMVPGDGQDVESSGRIVLSKIVAILKARTERDFSRYKQATLLRRIARRMQLNDIEDFERYLESLRSQPNEARTLADDLLITVTSFFRDPEVFRKLETDVVPRLFEGRGPDDSLRIWSVGCATGEEAYSIAMLFREEAARRETPPRIQIFASDLHKRSLDHARDGLYPGDIETDVSAERLKRFFHRANGGYRICKEVRDTVIFAPHNLLGDPPFSRLDLITCRNLLIYLERPVQRDVIDLFHYALCPRGYLLLGSAETIEAAELFRTEDKKLCLYRKRNVPPPESRLPVFPLTQLRWNSKSAAKSEDTPEAVPYDALHRMLLEQDTPPSILVSPDNQLLHVSAAAGRYLTHPEGEITSSALRLVREELRIDLQTLLQSARERKAPVDSQPLSVRFNGHAAPVVMRVVPGHDPEQDGFALVIFEEHEPKPNGGDRVQSDSSVGSSQEFARVAELEAELHTGRQRLQATIEEYETTREETKAANEEMQSINEELRSTLEELETSKEELQSINEELQAVNQENRHKVEELSQLSSDLQNLMAATDIATLFLDRDLRIMRFTPRLEELFNVRVTDRGRPISDLTHRLGYGQLRADAGAVLSRLIPIEREIRDEAGRWYLTNILPYRSTNDRIEGVVITFIDITRGKAVEGALRQSESRLRIASEAAGLGVFDWNPSDDSVSWENDRMFEIFGRPREEGALTTAMFLAGVVHPDDAESFQTELESSLTSGQIHYTGRFYRADGALRWVMFSGKVEFADNGTPLRMQGVTADVTDRMTVELALRESETRYHGLFEASPFPFMVLSPNPPDFTIAAANDAYLSATLTTRESLIGRSLFEVFTDDPNRPGQLGSDALALSLNRVLTSRRKDIMDRLRYDILTPDGEFEPNWWQAVNAPLFNASGQIGAILHQVTKVTELYLAEEAERRAQDALRESEAPSRNAR